MATSKSDFKGVFRRGRIEWRNAGSVRFGAGFKLCCERSDESGNHQGIRGSGSRRAM